MKLTLVEMDVFFISLVKHRADEAMKG
jgi:hypothetical protein